MATYDLLRDLSVEIEEVDSDRLVLDTSTGFVRVTTVVKLRGRGEEGVGEDVTYDGELHPPFREALPALPLTGSWTLDSFSRQVGDLDLFAGLELDQDAYRGYRRWAVESAALDLALRQAGTSLARAVGREPRPVMFVCSLNLGHPPSLDGLRKR